jgi:hypothetical protein
MKAASANPLPSCIMSGFAEPLEDINVMAAIERAMAALAARTAAA